jgi:hypothetical protein
MVELVGIELEPLCGRERGDGEAGAEREPAGEILSPSRRAKDLL